MLASGCMSVPGASGLLVVRRSLNDAVELPQGCFGLCRALSVSVRLGNSKVKGKPDRVTHFQHLRVGQSRDESPDLSLGYRLNMITVDCAIMRHPIVFGKEHLARYVPDS